MRTKKIKVGVQQTVTFDFGRFKSNVYINVPDKQWQDYLDKRLAFEVAHNEIRDLLRHNQILRVKQPLRA